MSNAVKKGKKLITVSAELVIQLNELANKRGILFSKYINDILREVLRAERTGRSLQEIVDLYEVMNLLKISGHVVVPLDILDWLVKKLPPKGQNGLQELWLNAGRWFGRLLNAEFGSEAFDFFIKILRLSQWEFEKVSLEKDENFMKLQLTSFTLSEESTILLMHYVEGVMESLGVKIEDKEHMKGFISLKLKKIGR